MPLNKKSIMTELRILFFMILIVSSLRSALADWNDVPTPSMKPTIQVGDRVVVNKLAYDLKIPFTRVQVARWGDPERGDIVVLFSPKGGTRLVKRVVGLPGDQIAMIDNKLFINGAPVPWSPPSTVATEHGDAMVVDETLGTRTHKVMLMPQLALGSYRSYPMHVVPPGHYFVLGDNRDNSNDSRFIGFIERRRIVGEAVAVAFSLDRSRYFVPRMDRFFEGLN